MSYKIYILRTLDDETPKYVGITSGKLNTRLNNHLHDIKRESCKNYHKKNWLSKYKQIDSTNSIEEMKEKEIFYIKKYRDAGIKLLNATDGGDGTYGYKHSKETIEKISGENNGKFGKPNLNNKEKLGKKVEYSKDGENWTLFNSIRDASKYTGVTHRFIKNMCDGNYTTDRKYYFRYHGDLFNQKKSRKKADQSIRKKKVEVYYNDNWLTFESAKEAAIYFNLKREKIVMVCNEKRNHTGGLIFRYKKEFDK
jgi:hypothetical protein